VSLDDAVELFDALNIAIHSPPPRMPPPGPWLVEPIIRPERDVDRVFIHCSDSDVETHANVETIRAWHTNPRPKGNGWSDIGYHWVINNHGAIWPGRPLERTPAAQRGHNRGTLAVCLTGRSEFAPVQFDALRLLADVLDAIYTAGDGLTYHSHCEVDPGKTCPNFDISDVLDLDWRGGRI